jgi:hypothetical protein
MLECLFRIFLDNKVRNLNNMKTIQKNKTAPARLNEKNENTVFDATRDNKGKGIRATDLIKILKKINN